MSVKLNEVVLWGRSLAEYQGMFNLTPGDLTQRILGCADGPASFNAEMTAQGGQTVSCDPIYEFSPQQIRGRFEDSIETVISQVKAHPGNYVWQFHSGPDDLVKNRRRAMERFLADYELGLRQGRYKKAELPQLPFRDQEFDLALCSHFLFLYSDHFSKEFHLSSILEMARVAREVRVFPLVGLNCEPAPHLIEVLDRMRERGFRVEVKKSSYQIQKNGDSFLRIWRAGARNVNAKID